MQPTNTNATEANMTKSRKSNTNTNTRKSVRKNAFDNSFDTGRIEWINVDGNEIMVVR